MDDVALQAPVRRFRAYAEHRESGEDFLGAIPSDWAVQRVKRLFHVVNGSTPASSEPDYWDGEIPWVTPEDLGKLEQRSVSDSARFITDLGYKRCGTSMVPSGSLVLSTRAPIGHVAIAARDLCTNQGCKSLVFRDPQSSDFFYFQALAARGRLEATGRGSTFKELATDDLEDVLFAVPSPGEQAAIAAFLDRETGKIDALVAKKRRLIELLQEKRTALITRAVTKGLDPSVPMKDSGVEWLGEIPTHWEVKRLWHLTASDRRIMYGIVLPGPNVDDGVPIVKGGDVAAARLKLEGLNRTTYEIESSYARSRLRGGDLVYAIRGSIGEVGMVPSELEGANVTQDAARISPESDVNGQWLLQALRSSRVFAQLEAGAVGATIRGINIRDLKRALLPVPPPAEQEAIAVYLGAHAERLAKMDERICDAIDRLIEFRSALISAAVTGRIDVREDAG